MPLIGNLVLLLQCLSCPYASLYVFFLEDVLGIHVAKRALKNHTHTRERQPQTNSEEGKGNTSKSHGKAQGNSIVFLLMLLKIGINTHIKKATLSGQHLEIGGKCPLTLGTRGD